MQEKVIRGGRQPYNQVVRNSNLELYRIISMFLIVCHHYVVSSGLMDVMNVDPLSTNSIFYYIFGMWGKTAINCFLMITGYFMCTSKITFRKFMKLIVWIYFYKFLIYGVFLITGYESIGIKGIIKLLMPVWGFSSNFTSCFLAFWLCIPFLNVLVHNITKKQHQYLLLLMLTIYTILPTIPFFHVQSNYIVWFSVLYFIASYIRLYPESIYMYQSTKVWAWFSVLTMVLAMMSVVSLLWLTDKIGLNPGYCYSLVADSNKPLAVLVGFTTFMFFKNIKMQYNPLINKLGAVTFGVLLIHANSDAMRQWLWRDVLDNAGHYSYPLYAIGCCLGVYLICSVIDYFRLRWIEPLYMNRIH